MLKSMRGRWIIGIDEVGRGALAGPLVVAAAAAKVGSMWQLVDRDSKRLTEQQRFRHVEAIMGDRGIYCVCVAVSHSTIDRFGVVAAATQGVRIVLRRLPQTLSIRYDLQPLVILDGGLVAPPEYRQLTVIRGDAQLPCIAAASIVAKVNRDRFMHRMHDRYPQYGFDRHVGYGTKLHYEALRHYGPSPVHRRSFRLA